MLSFQIFMYVTVFLSIYAALNSVNIIFKTQLKSIPSEISEMICQKNKFILIHEKNDFLSAYYYELSFIFLIFNTNLYLALNFNSTTLLFIFQLMSAISIFYFLSSIFYSYKVLYLNIAKEAFRNSFSYNDFFESYFIKINIIEKDIGETIINSNLSNISYEDYLDLIKLDNSIQPLKKSLFNEFKYLFNNNIIVIYKYKLALIEDHKISYIDFDYTHSYYILTTMEKTDIKIKRHLYNVFIYLYVIIYFIIWR